MKPFKIIAEIGSTHDGKIDLALKSIRKAAKCGADIVKFQMHIQMKNLEMYHLTLKRKKI